MGLVVSHLQFAPLNIGKVNKIYIVLFSGHTRYSTFGGSDTSNIQPFVVETLHGLMAVAHNGELVNSAQIKQKVSFAGRNLNYTMIY